MNNQQLALLLTQYMRVLDKGLDKVCENIPEHKETRNLLPGLQITEYTCYPVLDPVNDVIRSMAEDIGKLEKDPYQDLTQQPQSVQEPPRKGKEVITFEQDHICVNGANLGVHDLLMYARLILKKGIREVDTARLYVELEEVIRTNQNLRGIEPGARMQELE